jgi:hypothetical protein
MKRDPLFKKIVAGLDGALDPDTFELAVVDLLKPVWPTLVPVKGGSDDGMDGAVGNSEGEPFPFVTTTSKDVIGNLTRNLNSYKDSGGQQQQVLLATSQALTPQRRKNLHTRANELGFTLLQIHDQTDLAQRLYQSPKWCKELLNLEGDPAPLSTIPRSSRPYYDQPLIGREETIHWLKTVKSDSLLVGQPGSGKTFLLQQLALNENYGLFVTSKDRGEIAAAVREYKPRILIVDDAHIEHNLLLDLKQLRKETEADFIILATSWPGEAQAVAEVLSISEQNVHTLELLTRDQVVKIVHEVGIEYPVWLVREIVSQSRGRPGLAVTLTHVCIQGGYKEFITARLLSRTTLEAIKKLVGKDAAEILAAHAVGGDAGLPMSVVAKILGINLVELRSIVTKLAAGGIVFEKRENLAITPSALQHALIRDVFFNGATSLPREILRDLIDNTPSLAETAIALFGARARGAEVPHQLLVELVEKTKLWEDFAHIGDNEVQWLIEHHPEVMVDIAKPALERLPHKALPLLLAEAVGDDRPLNSHPNHPLRQIEDWVKGLLPTGLEVSRRKQILFEALEMWLSSGGDSKVGLQCLTYVFDPTFRTHEADPGAGMSINIRHGSITLDNLIEIWKLWPRTVHLISTLDISHWNPFLSIVHDWLFGRMENQGADEQEFVSTCAKQMVADLAKIAQAHPGVLHHLKRDVAWARVDISIPSNEFFDVLYPIERPRGNWEEREAKQFQQVLNLAKTWSQEPVDSVIDRITWIEKEANSVNLNYPAHLNRLCYDLANNVSDPLLWARKMIEKQVNPNFVIPFLETAVRINDEDSWNTLEACMDSNVYTAVGVLITLSYNAVPQNLVARALERINEVSWIARNLTYNPNVSEQVRKSLLEHNEMQVAVNAVEGETHRYVAGELSDALKNSYEKAFIRFAKSQDDFTVSQAVKNNEDLAYRWLRSIMNEEEYPRFYLYDSALEAAVAALGLEKRQQLIQEVPNRWGFDELVILLVGDDLALYKAMVKNSKLSELHLIPLQGQPNKAWIERAKVALDAGYSPKAIVGATFPIMHSYSGDESKYWQGWIDAYSTLLDNEDVRIREIGKLGVASKTAQRDSALFKEKQEAIHGR